MYRAEKASSRICRDRDVAKAQRIHRKKIETVHPSIKTQPATTQANGAGGHNGSFSPLRTKELKGSDSPPTHTRHHQPHQPQQPQWSKATIGSEYEDDFNVDEAVHEQPQEPLEEQPLAPPPPQAEKKETIAIKQHHRQRHQHKKPTQQQSCLKQNDLRDPTDTTTTFSAANDPIRIVPMESTSLFPSHPDQLARKKSLHKSFRMKRLKEIQVDNLNLFERIKKSTAHYDNAKMRQDWKQNVTYLQSISSYPLAAKLLEPDTDGKWSRVDKLEAEATKAYSPQSPSLNGQDQPLTFQPAHAITVLPISTKRPVVNLAPGFRSLRKAMPQQPSLPPLEMHASYAKNYQHPPPMHQTKLGAPTPLQPTPPPPLTSRTTANGDKTRNLTSPRPPPSSPRLAAQANISNASFLDIAANGDQILKTGRFVEGHYLVLTVFRGDACYNPYGFDVLAVNPSLQTSYLLQITKQMTHQLLEQVGSVTCVKTMEAAGTNLSVERIAKILSEQVHFTLLEGGGEMFFLFCSCGFPPVLHTTENDDSQILDELHGAASTNPAAAAVKDTNAKHLLLINKPTNFVFCIRKEIEMLIPNDPSKQPGATQDQESGPDTMLQLSLVNLMIRNCPVLDSTRGESCTIRFQLFEAHEHPSPAVASMGALPMTPDALLARQITSIESLDLQYEEMCDFMAKLDPKSDLPSLEIACISLIDYMSLQKMPIAVKTATSTATVSFPASNGTRKVLPQYQLVVCIDQQAQDEFKPLVLQSGMIWKDNYFVIRAYTCDALTGELHDDIPVSVHQLVVEWQGNLVVTMFLPQHDVDLRKELTCQDLELVLEKLLMSDQRAYMELDSLVKLMVPFLDVQAQDFCTQTVELDFPRLLVHESLVKLSPRQRKIRMNQRNNSSKSHDAMQQQQTPTDGSDELPESPQNQLSSTNQPGHHHQQQQEDKEDEDEIDESEGLDQFMSTKAATSIQASWRGFSNRRNTPFPTMTTNAMKVKSSVPTSHPKNNDKTMEDDDGFSRFSVGKARELANKPLPLSTIKTEPNDSAPSETTTSSGLLTDANDQQDRRDLLHDLEQDDIQIVMWNQNIAEYEHDLYDNEDLQDADEVDVAKAAQKIQCHYRGFACRQHLKHHHHHQRHQAAQRIQSHYRGFACRQQLKHHQRHQAAQRIQSHYRGFACRHHLKPQPKHKRSPPKARANSKVDEAAQKIQSHYRGFACRQHLKQQPQKHKRSPPKARANSKVDEAAQKIQSHYRGFACRQHLKQVPKGHSASNRRIEVKAKDQAAQKIQSHYRDYFCRKRLNPPQQQKTSHKTRHTQKGKRELDPKIVDKAAKRIQCHFRGFSCRKQHGFPKYNTKKSAVLHPQEATAFDTIKARLLQTLPHDLGIAYSDEILMDAAKSIQAHFRGYRVRRTVYVKAHDGTRSTSMVVMVVDHDAKAQEQQLSNNAHGPHQAQADAAATRIQAQFRGFFVRKHMPKGKVHRLVVTDVKDVPVPSTEDHAMMAKPLENQPLETVSTDVQNQPSVRLEQSQKDQEVIKSPDFDSESATANCDYEQEFETDQELVPAATYQHDTGGET